MSLDVNFVFWWEVMVKDYYEMIVIIKMRSRSLWSRYTDTWQKYRRAASTVRSKIFENRIDLIDRDRIADSPISNRYTFWCCYIMLLYTLFWHMNVLYFIYFVTFFSQNIVKWHRRRKARNLYLVISRQLVYSS